jgi:calcineurin-like phosphoesterase family protein
MSEIWLISDTHFGHENILNFKTENGEKLRNFNSIDEMHYTIIERWNSVVNPSDKVYHLGDVAMSLKSMDTVLPLLNGSKRLIRGNHDLFKTRRYLTHFKEVYGVRQINGYWLTHIPMQEGSMFRAKKNIHGHLHEKLVMLGGEIDERYCNVSVEQINYTPINFEELKL